MSISFFFLSLRAFFYHQAQAIDVNHYNCALFCCCFCCCCCRLIRLIIASIFHLLLHKGDLYLYAYRWDCEYVLCICVCSVLAFLLPHYSIWKYHVVVGCCCFFFFWTFNATKEGRPHTDSHHKPFTSILKIYV